MDAINQMIIWLEANWGTAIFGTVSLGTVVTTLVVLVKQWIGNKAQGTKYEAMWNSSQDTISKWATLYEAERAKSAEVSHENAFLKASQTVMFDALTKMALASKLDSDDKVSIVANIERLKLMEPTEIIENVKQTSETVMTNAAEELNENPAQTVVNVINSAGSLLDKYTTKKE